MTTLREAAEMALDYMDSVGQQDMYPEEWAVAEALRAALEQPEQEQQCSGCGKTDTGWALYCVECIERQITPAMVADAAEQMRIKCLAIVEEHGMSQDIIGRDIRGLKGKFPPQRKPLTEEEIYEVLGYGTTMQHNFVPQYAINMIRAIERAHGIGGEK